MSDSTQPHLRRGQLAAMNIHYVYYSLEYFLATQERLGFQTIELWCAEPHVHLDHLSYADAKKLKTQISSHHLNLACITPENCVYPYQFAAADPDHFARSKAYFENGIRLAAELGCPRMAINSGWGNFDEPAADAWKRSVAMLSHLAAFAADKNVRLVMESLRPEESQLVTTLATNQKMIAEVGNPNLVPMVDTCAMGVAHETLDQWFAAYGERINHMHFIDGTPYGHLVWGDGTHNLKEFIAALNRHNYQGYLGQELTDGAYYADPAQVDAKNIAAFEPFFVD